MARIRTIRPEFWESEKVGRLTPLARLTFVGLISLADDEGRGRGSQTFLLGRLHPYGGVTVAELAAATEEISVAGLAEWYKTAEDCVFYAIPGFRDNQYIEKPKKSIIPPPPTRKQSGIRPRRVGDASPTGRGSIPPGMEGKGMERKGRDIAAAPQQIEVRSESGRKIYTPIQQIIRAFKEAKRIDADDFEWDKKHFKRFARAAADIEKIFKDRTDDAVEYILAKGDEFDTQNLVGWGLEGIARAAATDPRAERNHGGENGRENGTVGAAGMVRSERSSITAAAGNLVGDALRALESDAVRTEEPAVLAGPSENKDDDDTPFA